MFPVTERSDARQEIPTARGSSQLWCIRSRWMPCVVVMSYMRKPRAAKSATLYAARTTYMQR